jgi:hypothetical protein
VLPCGGGSAININHQTSIIAAPLDSIQFDCRISIQLPHPQSAAVSMPPSPSPQDLSTAIATGTPPVMP